MESRLAGAGHDVVHQAVRIENQGDGSIAEDRGARNYLNVAIQPAQVFDYGLMISEHLVDDEAVVPVLGFDHHDLLAFRRAVFHLEVLAEPDVGNEFAAHVRQMIAVRVLDVLAGELDAFQAVGQRQHEMRRPTRTSSPSMMARVEEDGV